MLKFTLDQEEKNFKYGDSKIILRIIYPCESEGAWAGTRVTLHEWKIFKKENGICYKNATQEEVIEFEKILGLWDVGYFWNHPGLGLVFSEYKE